MMTFGRWSKPPRAATPDQVALWEAWIVLQQYGVDISPEQLVVAQAILTRKAPAARKAASQGAL